MIHFKDFLPQTVSETKVLGVFSGTSYQTLSDMMATVNEWVRTSRVRVINIETIAIPHPTEDKFTNPSSTAELMIVGGFATLYWFQFVRVWYEED